MYRSLEFRISTIPNVYGTGAWLARGAGWKFLEGKIRLKKFGSCGDLTLAIPDHLFRYFSRKEIGSSPGQTVVIMRALDSVLN
jgi:hypothetical protein